MHLFEVYQRNDIIIEKALGSFVWDDKGNRYLDMYGGHAVISIGHLHPHWTRSLQEQLGRIAFYSNSVIIPLQEALADKLAVVSGKPDYRLFLCNSGAEANENALKLASFTNGRKKVIAFSKSFHGRTSLAVAATDNPSIVAPVNRTDNIVFLPFNDVAALEACFDQMGNEISSVIVEGIQGVGGIIEASVPFIKAISSNCERFGALFIADSVQCGYGRTGRFFAHDIAGVDADIYTMAKGMGNGFPVGGILVSPRVPQKVGMLGTTFGGNHLACAAAMAVLETIENENLLANAASVGDYLLANLAQIEGLRNIRGRGLMIGFDVEGSLASVRKHLLNNRSVFTGEAKPNVVRLLPSLALTLEEADLFLEALRSVVFSLRA